MRSRFSLLAALLLALTGAVAARAGISVERSVGAAPIVRIATLPEADLVVLGAGLEVGLRQGMVCSVLRRDEQIAEVLLVDMRPRAATALILALAPGRTLQPGDVATVKTVSSRS
jgi:hypothetical protein